MPTYQLRTCLECGLDFEPQYQNAKFCSPTCSGNHPYTSGKYKKHNNICIRCGKRCRSANVKHCCISCRDEHLISDWLNGKSFNKSYGRITPTIRKFLLEEVDHTCPLCGWNQKNPLSGKVPLEIDHKNGDSSDNRRCNLQVLCPNCHSLTPTYRTLNKGVGRKQKEHERALSRSC